MQVLSSFVIHGKLAYAYESWPLGLRTVQRYLSLARSKANSYELAVQPQTKYTVSYSTDHVKGKCCSRVTRAVRTPNSQGMYIHVVLASERIILAREEALLARAVPILASASTSASAGTSTSTRRVTERRRIERMEHCTEPGYYSHYNFSMLHKASRTL